MHNPTAILENDTHKLLWDFDVQTDHLILDRRPDLIVIIKKKKKKKEKKREIAKLSTFLTTEWNWENVKRRINTSILLENWKTVEHEGDTYTSPDWCF